MNENKSATSALRMLAKLFLRPPLESVFLKCYTAGDTEEEALKIFHAIHASGSGIISDFLGEETLTKEGALTARHMYRKHISSLVGLKRENPDMRLAVSIKLSQLGMKFDCLLASTLAKKIFVDATGCGIKFEIDMEGPETIDSTIGIMRSLLRVGNNYRIAVPANQSKADEVLKTCVQYHIGVRIVKGAYPGDIEQHAINENFLRLRGAARSAGLDVALGTHDDAMIVPGVPVQKLFGVRMYSKRDWTYAPWGFHRRQYLLRRIDEGVRWNVFLLFLRNIRESLRWQREFCTH